MTDSKSVPPGEPAHDPLEEAKKSPEFREALKKDDEREARADFNPDRDVWKRTGAGPDVPKTDPQESQKREEKRARREVGY